MAIIPCPECANKVSNVAPSCPRCGFPVAAWREEERRKYFSAQGNADRSVAPARPINRRRAVLLALAVVAALGTLIVLAVQSAQEPGSSEATDQEELQLSSSETPGQAAYDAGYEFFVSADEGGGRLSCTWMEYQHRQAVSAIQNGRADLADELAGASYKSIMGTLQKEGASFGDSQIFFISGFWDAAQTICPGAFFETDIAGRPQG